MARYNSIYAGPFTEPTPQVQEAICDAAAMPGTALVWAAAKFAVAGASAIAKVFICQDNYLALKNVDVAWPEGDRIIGMELLDEQFFNVLVPTGVNVLKGSELTTNATGRFILALTTNKVIAQAEEAYNNTSGVDQLVRVRAVNGYLKA